MTENAHSHGTLGEEAQKLAEAVQDWMNGAGARWADADRSSGPAPECRVCPVCQLLRLLGGANPEVFAHLADAAASLSAAFRELLGDAAGRTPPDARRGGVEHIDLG